MKTIRLLLIPLLVVSATSCDQQQTKIFALQEEYQRQLHGKEKAIEELNQKIQTLQNDKDKLNDGLMQAVKEFQSGGHLADQVSESVGKKMTAQWSGTFAELKAKLDQLDQAVQATKALAQRAPEAAPAPAPIQNTNRGPDKGQPQPEPPKVRDRDPNVKRYKLEF